MMRRGPKVLSLVRLAGHVDYAVATEIQHRLASRRCCAAPNANQRHLFLPPTNSNQRYPYRPVAQPAIHKCVRVCACVSPPPSPLCS